MSAEYSKTQELLRLLRDYNIELTAYTLERGLDNARVKRLLKCTKAGRGLAHGRILSPQTSNCHRADIAALFAIYTCAPQESGSAVVLVQCA